MSKEPSLPVVAERVVLVRVSRYGDGCASSRVTAGRRHVAAYGTGRCLCAGSHWNSQHQDDKPGQQVESRKEGADLVFHLRSLQWIGGRINRSRCDILIAPGKKIGKSAVIFVRREDPLLVICCKI